MRVVDTLAPIFLIIALGAGLRAGNFFTPAMIAMANRLTYYVGLPALFVHEITRSRAALGDHADALFAFMLATLAVGLAAYAVAFLLRTPWDSVGTFVQAAIRGNLAFIGLPVIAFSTPGEPDALPIAIILISLMLPLINIACVVVLLVSKHELGRGAVRRVVLQLAVNPLILGCLAGALLAWLAPPLPDALSRTLGSIGSIASPLALLAIGASLRLEHVHEGFPRVLAGSLLKVALLPFFGALLARGFGLSPLEAHVALILMACPAAAASFVLVDQIGGDRHLAAGTVALGTLLSLVSLSTILLLYGSR